MARLPKPFEYNGTGQIICKNLTCSGSCGSSEIKKNCYIEEFEMLKAANKVKVDVKAYQTELEEIRRSPEMLRAIGGIFVDVIEALIRNEVKYYSLGVGQSKAVPLMTINLFDGDKLYAGGNLPGEFFREVADKFGTEDAIPEPKPTVSKKLNQSRLPE